MPHDRTLITLAELVAEAGAIVDPTGIDPAVTEFVVRYEDDDRPVRGLLDGLEELLRWGADDHPPVVVAQAIVLYLAHRLDEARDDAASILRLVERAEFDGNPEPPIAQWFEEHAAA